MNIINGGAHADNAIDIQEFMIVPVGATNVKESMKIGCEIYHTLKGVLHKAGLSTNVGDEGGFAPNLSSSKEALDYILKAIEQAGYEPGEDVALALDVAATELFKDNIYNFKGEKAKFKAPDLVDYYIKLCENYPIISIEDGMAEDDFEGWKLLTDALGGEIQLVGDDVF